MGTKNNPGEFDCYADAEPDEPIFILRGNDPSAPEAVRHWAGHYEVRKELQNLRERGAIKLTEKQRRKVDEAEALADSMQAWRKEP